MDGPIPKSKLIFFNCPPSNHPPSTPLSIGNKYGHGTNNRPNKYSNGEKYQPYYLLYGQVS